MHFLFSDHICYDDGCHLRKFVQNPQRCNITPTATKLSQIRIAVDKMHIKGHTDPWCLANCDPRKIPELDHVCEILLSTTFFSQYVMAHTRIL